MIEGRAEQIALLQDKVRALHERLSAVESKSRA